MIEYDLPLGIYESLIDSTLQRALSEIKTDEIVPEKIPIDEHALPNILSRYLQSEIIEAMHRFPASNKLEQQVSLANKILATINSQTNDHHSELKVVPSHPEILLSVNSNNLQDVFKRKAHASRPNTGIRDSFLFTSTDKDLTLATELKKELQSSNTVYILMSFIRWSGLRILFNALSDFVEHTENSLKIITTTYMGATELKCLDELCNLPRTEVKISLDSTHTRLHAKAYLFKRNTGFHTSYIGSSNISNPAITSGLEWNVKLTAQDASHIIDKFEASYDAIWHSDKFITFNDVSREDVIEALQISKKPTNDPSEYFFEVKPFLYQRDILEKLHAERIVHNRHKNLVVSATGTGKTVVSALDFKRFLMEQPGANLLFIAHRREILDQSLKCYRGVLRDPNFGELFTGIDRPTGFKNIFASIQTLHSKQMWQKLSEDHFDFIVIDEFHHAEAKTYQGILDHFKPKVLLGLTATPERMDGADILRFFDGRIAAEIRLYDAIDRNLLCPFQYFGVSDDVDLSQLSWKQGGYLLSDLENIYTGNDARVQLIIDALHRYMADIDSITGLGFCVSVKHAEFMSRSFNSYGIPSEHLTGQSDKDRRKIAQKKLENGEIKFIFTVDLFNEGIDIPKVDTILFLRPTESMTVFIQQLGRGLRLSEGKECLTVLDFIGQAHKKYRFDKKFKTLLKENKNSVKKEIENEFPHLPSGCYIQLEKLAAERILQNIKQNINSNRKALTVRITEFTEESGLPATLKNFLTYHNLSLKDFYSNDNISWSQLCYEAGITPAPTDPDFEHLTKGIRRLAHINSKIYLEFIRNLLTGELPLFENLSEDHRKMFWMFYYRLWRKPLVELNFKNPDEATQKLIANRNICSELLQILEICLESNDIADRQIDLGYPCPLTLHANYSLDEILSAFGRSNELGVEEFREGTKYLPDIKTDIHLITLNKSDKDFSPSTMYDDYAINERLFHWQSQSKTSDHTETGKRYINHKEMGTYILLFVREQKKENGMPMPYFFLGPVNYISHSGNRPMSITVSLEHEMPARIWQQADRFSVA